jgi:outer membrane immunogenic protein
MKRIVVSLMFTVGAAATALAADLPPPAPVPARAPAVYVPPAPVYNWNGLYFGVNGGWAFGKSKWSVASSTTGDFNVNGGLVGATLGANWQVDAWVLGLEGDFDGQWLDGKSSVCLPVNCETKSNWLATLRGRFGYAADRVLIYATGGGAFANIAANTSTTFQSQSKGGWTAGAGLEAAFAENWTARVEYLFVDLQNASFTPVPAVPITVKLNENLIRVGVDYKFR